MNRILIAVSFAVLLAACAIKPSVTPPPTTPPAAKAPLPAATSPPVVLPSPEQLRADVNGFIDEMVRKHGFDRQQLESLFKEVDFRKDIIETISRPAEGKPWHQYRPIFLQRARIEGGAEFWERNADALQRAEAEYGVPPQIIVAIIGVETRYGSHKGKHRIIDALATLAFEYPPRAKFFRSELEHYLLLTREENLDPLDMKGSYAGAFGQPQFISSSYRRYAIDFDGDGKRDLWENSTDAVGSVANYLKENGWESGGGVAVQAAVNGAAFEPFLKDGLKPVRTWKDIRAQGVTAQGNLTDSTPVALIAFEQEQGPEYWLGLQNFYAITRYNRSPLYAMAVYQLSEEIRKLHEQRTSRAAPNQ